MLCVPWLFVLSGWAAPAHLVNEEPVSIAEVDTGTYLVDFGRVAFGNVRLSSPKKATVTVHFGEALTEGRVNRKPPGTVRYGKATVQLDKAGVVAAPPADARNTNIKKNAVLTPKGWGVVLPFRWVEIEGWPGELKPEQITRQAAYLSTWNDDAAAFECSSEMLNRIWELCRYSIKATTFAGVYVDGDRERIPYEADACLNQVSHYYTDNSIQMARDTFEYLMKHPTWPTEWASHMVFMAHADWMQTGDVQWLRKHYDALESKLLLDRVGDDHLVHSNKKQIKKGDLVDWPKGERDGFVFSGVNSVVNAFFIQALEEMAELATVLGKNSDAKKWAAGAGDARAAFQAHFFNTESGRYVDGVGTDHTSVHANLFPLAFGLVPEEHRQAITDWLAGQGMKCSVYAAQYFMEALFENGADEAAVSLMTAPGDRSWRHMVESGATITWEAWDLKYKPNLDWNHAWGAALANLLPRYVLGVEALRPGWAAARIRPCPSGLDYAKGKVPTPRGPVYVEWKKADTFTLSVDLPANMPVQLELPAGECSTGVLMDGRPISARRVGDRWILNPSVFRKAVFIVKCVSRNAEGTE